MTIRQQIAKQLQISVSRVSQLKSLGCPVSTVEGAKQWVAERVMRPRKKKEAPLIVLSSQKNEGTGFVYVLIESGTSAIKIGFSQKRPLQRCRDCQIGNPRRLYVAHFRRHDCALEIERKLHLQFGDRRLSGEWFHVPLWEVLQAMDKFDGWKPVVYRDGSVWEFQNNEKEAA